MRRAGQPQETTLPKVVGEDRARIRKLEFRKSGSGLKFNDGTYGPENAGDWLQVTTSDTNPDTDDGIHLEATDHDVSVIAGNILFLQGDAEVDITSSGGPIAINAGTSPVTIQVNSQTFTFADDGTITLPSGAVIGP